MSKKPSGNNGTTKERLTILVVSGSQFRAIKRQGIHKKFAGSVRFVYGPGCVLCSSPARYFDKLIRISREEKTIVATGPNYLKIPGNGSTLEKERQQGGEIRTVYTLQDVLLLAKHKRRHKIVFPALGFETMAAATAATVLQAKVAGLFNFTVLNYHRPLLPLVERFLLSRKNINAVLFSAYDVTVTGTGILKSFAKKNNLKAAVTGEEGEQLAEAVEQLIKNNGIPLFTNKEYRLKPEGETKSQQLINEVFETLSNDSDDPFDSPYYVLSDQYALHDASKRFQKLHNEPAENGTKDCICGKIIKGEASVEQCSRFKKECTPLNPSGACMASPEGICQIEFLYGGTVG